MPSAARDPQGSTLGRAIAVALALAAALEASAVTDAAAPAGAVLGGAGARTASRSAPPPGAREPDDPARQEALAAERERRLRGREEELAARERAAAEEAAVLAARERDLSEREQRLDAREQRSATRGTPSAQERQLKAREADLAARERQLSALQRSFAPAIEAARGREREAATREESERDDGGRTPQAGAPAQPDDDRERRLAATGRRLAALDARIAAMGEWLDALGRQLAARRDRLDLWSRRLDGRSERIGVAEKHATSSPRAGSGGTAARPARPKTRPAVLAIWSPTAIVNDRSADGPGAVSDAALHPGIAVDKEVAAATVLAFPTLATELSELDREAVDRIARLAARERCELLIWARPKDPAGMAHAQQRAAQLRARVVEAGPLDPKQVVTRITTSRGARGVDVVVSALRAAPSGAAAPSAPLPGAARSPVPRVGARELDPGEGGKRQVREAVALAKAPIAACLGDHLDLKKLERADGVLKLTVSAGGRVTRVATGGGELAGTELEACLTRAASASPFPVADADYRAEVPITAIRAAAR